MSDIEIGTVYDMAKTIAKIEKPLTEDELKKQLEKIKEFFLTEKDKYFMLLNKETNNFTLFNLGIKDDITIKRIMQDFKECLQNRGSVISMDLTENGTCEIWIIINNEAFVYYLFPYDIGVIE